VFVFLGFKVFRLNNIRRALPSFAFNNTKSFHFVNYSLNWTEAQSVSDVIMLRSQISNSTGEFLIIDLKNKPQLAMIDLENDWRWSLNDSSFYGEGERTFRNWYSDQPNNLNEQRCVAAALGNSGRWSDEVCSLNLSFICYTTGRHLHFYSKI
uniref:C-type lectin domain-containing protein n=1 Tax=Gouania willdenowi TaxID=441366 RepID=A0A8C5H2W8_GOUWI